jgi:hypothetical protein
MGVGVAVGGLVVGVGGFVGKKPDDPLDEKKPPGSDVAVGGGVGVGLEALPCWGV